MVVTFEKTRIIPHDVVQSSDAPANASPIESAHNSVGSVLSP